MNTSPGFRGGLSRMTARVVGSRFAKPIARAALVATSVVVLAIIGHAASPRALTTSASAATASSPPIESPAREPASAPVAATAPVPPSSAPAAEAPASPRGGPASADDPVVLNTATVEDFRRLPGVGEKRANAIFALRARLGRFHALEDLLKVKGIGRATLKRLRPLVRLDPKAPEDGGFAPAPNTSSPSNDGKF